MLRTPPTLATTDRPAGLETRPAYEVDPYLARLETRIVGAGTDERGAFAVLADTILYPEGGGQPADLGRLRQDIAAEPGVWEVIDVRRVGAERRHYLAAQAPAPGPVLVELDWSRRYDHMQQHSAQHLLSALAEDMYGWPTTSFHLGAEVSDVELDVPALRHTQIVALEDAVASHVRASRPLFQSYVNMGAGVPTGVRSRGLPEAHSGPVRLIEIEGVDLCACGGTHVRSTAELEAVKLLHWEPMRGGTRVYFVAGARTRHRLGAAEERLRELRGLLGVPETEMADAVRVRLEQSAALGRALQGRDRALAEAHARRLAGSTSGVACERLDGELVTLVAQAATKLDGRALVIVASDTDSGVFALGGGLACGKDVQAAGALVARAVAGRGGGSGRLYTGRADGLDRLPEAVAELTGAS